MLPFYTDASVIKSIVDKGINTEARPSIKRDQPVSVTQTAQGKKSKRARQ
jgi:hypothetical protein